MNDIVVWSIIGMILMALEIFGIPGIGILFTGFSAITVAFTIYLDAQLIDDIAAQLLYFFFYTVVWAAILWIPMNKFIQYNDNGDYTNIINTYATTHNDMKKGDFGEVMWSGTKVRAMIEEDNLDEEIPAKTTVKIASVIDGIFYITNNIRKETPENEIKNYHKK
jgi:membrane protein implicated in regulation of membrane protease activity